MYKIKLHLKGLLLHLKELLADLSALTYIRGMGGGRKLYIQAGNCPGFNYMPFCKMN